MIKKYGCEFPDGTNDATIELFCFRHGIEPDQGGLGKYGHFRAGVDLLWNNPNKPALRNFIWSPWAEDMIYEACYNKELVVAGCASSGKSDTFALWGIVNYLAAPTETLVMFTSTTLREARRRIWKSVTELWGAVPGLPGKPVNSLGLIKGLMPDGSYGESTGLGLIPAERRKEKEAIGKLIGIKQKRVFLVGDELPELPESLLHAAYTNLSNNPEFHFVGLGNPNGYFDAFGLMAEPEGGWETITEQDYEWKTSRGVCIRFDASKNPNLTEPGNKYPWMPTQSNIDAAEKKYGSNSLLFYRMFKGFWCPDGAEDAIYSPADLLSGNAFRKIKEWDAPPTKVGGLDPSFTQGGDRVMLYHGLFGKVDGLDVLEFGDYETLQENINLEDESRTFQLANMFRDRNIEYGVVPRHSGIDSTGGGGPFLDVCREKWSFEIKGVNFSGRASDRAVSADEPEVPGHERYYNRMSELWYQGVEFLRCGQLAGLSKEMAKEMTARKYTTTPGGKIKVEPKKDYKMRTGKSPDLADAGFVMLDVACQLGLLPVGRFERSKERREKWSNKMRRFDDIYDESTQLRNDN